MGRAASDEFYVLDLCDQVLSETGRRQHRFEWLLGDPGVTGKCVRLPVDSYWPNANMVVESAECIADCSVRSMTPAVTNSSQPTASG